MTTPPINTQTPSPLHEGGPGQLMDAYGNLVAACQSYGAGIVPAGYVCPWHLTEPNARLLCASFNAFDKAGRELSLDAATLAARIDITALIRLARDVGRVYPDRLLKRASSLVRSIDA